MQLISLQNIDRFLNCKLIAVAGASRKAKSFSASAIAHLWAKGYTILSINPNFVENNDGRYEFKQPGMHIYLRANNSIDFGVEKYSITNVYLSQVIRLGSRLWSKDN